MTIPWYQLPAGYNRWANARLYGAALALPEEAYRRSVGVFFGSLHRTLNHLLVADRIWLWRLTGTGERPDRLDAILYDDRIDLARARIAEDDRFIALSDQWDSTELERPHIYRNLAGEPFEQPLAEILMHVFTHQTHHRGQAHACLSILTGTEPPSFDLIQFQRGAPAPDLEAVISSLRP